MAFKLRRLAYRCGILLLVIINIGIFWRSSLRFASKDRPFTSYTEDLSSITGLAPVPMNYSCANTPLDPQILRIFTKPNSITRPLILFPPNPTKKKFYEITQNQPLCIRIIIPPLKDEDKLPFRSYFIPIDEAESNSWEQMMVFAEGTNSKSVRMVDMRPWQGFWSLNVSRTFGGHNGITWARHMDSLHAKLPHVEREIVIYDSRRRPPRDIPHVLEGELRLLDIDIYTLTAMVEYYDAFWNCEAYPPLAYSPQNISGTEGLTIRVVEEKESHLDFKPRYDSHHDNSLQVRGPRSLTAYSYSGHLRLPVCRSASNPGRWLHTSLLRRSLVDPPLQTTNTSYIWAPYTCRLQPMTYFNFQRCLERKYPVVHWFGDSHSRRALKTIFTGGKWCAPRSENPDRWDREDREIRNNNQEDTKQIACDCDDSSEPLTTRMFLLGTDGGAEMSWPNKDTHSRVRFYKMGGLTEKDNSILNFRYLFNSDSGGYQGEYPDLVIFGLVNWDSAFTPFHIYRKQLDEFLKLLTTRYSHPRTRFIYRSAQYHCCMADFSYWSRRWSTLRVETFEFYTRRRVQETLGPRVAVWDVYEMGKQRRYNEKKSSANNCASNHALASIIDLENLVLMNALCAE